MKLAVKANARTANAARFSASKTLHALDAVKNTMKAATKGYAMVSGLLLRF